MLLCDIFSFVIVSLKVRLEHWITGKFGALQISYIITIVIITTVAYQASFARCECLSHSVWE